MRSQELFSRAKSVIPGGVNSPVRAFGSVGGTPLFISRGQGPFIFDVDENRYIDYVLSWGPLILGHASGQVLRAISETAENGTSFGAPTELEVELAELVCQLVPGIEVVRMTSSGTEAAMSAVRLARGYTGRKLIIKFNGCYHGHADSMLIAAGSGVATLGIPGSPGVPEEIAQLTLSIEYNDLALLREALDRVGPETVAAILVEPVAANMGLILPQPGFLAGLREICSQFGIVLIFDEVITGFRVALGGAQVRFQVAPDLTILGKVLGGGLPVAAYGGRREIMAHVAPAGNVYQAGTLSGNPLAMAAGLTTLRILRETNPFPVLEDQAQTLATGLREAAGECGIPFVSASCGSLFGFFFAELPVINYQGAKLANSDVFRRFFHGMLREGVYLAPSPFETGFLSTAHTSAIIDQTLEAARGVFRSLYSA